MKRTIESKSVFLPVPRPGNREIRRLNNPILPFIRSGKDSF